MIVGAQGYTVRQFMQNERDMARTLQKIAKIGYTTIQISGIGPIDPKVIRKLCDDNGLKIALTHTPEARILNETEKVIEDHNVMGCDYIGLGAIPERYRAAGSEWIGYFAEDFVPVAEKIKAAGKLFMYHNHNFEFGRMQDGRLMMDVILDAIPADLMGITLDTYWLQAGGCDLYEWIEKLGDRLPCVHLKDMAVRGYDIRMAAVGRGNLNFAAILALLKKIGKTKYLLVEQDDCYGESPFDCLKQSYDHLVSLGYK